MTASSRAEVTLYDLHTHSHFSDGILTPADLVSRAKARGVTTIALTDHDTVAGQAELANAATSQGLNWVTGIEFSCLWRGVGIHIVGLNFDAKAPVMAAAVAQQTKARRDRALAIAQRLEKKGIGGALEGAKEEAGKGEIGRPHFAHFLVKQGHCRSISAAFKQYLGAGKAGDVKQLWPDIDVAIDWINQSNGVAVLAHPNKYDLTRTKLKALLADFVAAGGRAVEVVSGSQSAKDTETLSQLASEFGLQASCGSDFHVPDQSWQELGCHGGLPDHCEPVWRSFAAEQH